MHFNNKNLGRVIIDKMKRGWEYVMIDIKPWPLI